MKSYETSTVEPPFSEDPLYKDESWLIKPALKMEGRTEAHPISPFLNFVETGDNNREISQHEKLGPSGKGGPF